MGISKEIVIGITGAAIGAGVFAALEAVMQGHGLQLPAAEMSALKDILQPEVGALIGWAGLRLIAHVGRDTGVSGLSPEQKAKIAQQNSQQLQENAEANDSLWKTMTGGR